MSLVASVRKAILQRVTHVAYALRKIIKGHELKSFQHKQFIERILCMRPDTMYIRVFGEPTSRFCTTEFCYFIAGGNGAVYSTVFFSDETPMPYVYRLLLHAADPKTGMVEDPFHFLSNHFRVLGDYLGQRT